MSLIDRPARCVFRLIRFAASRPTYVFAFDWKNLIELLLLLLLLHTFSGLFSGQPG